jgi:hypothetical protein
MGKTRKARPKRGRIIPLLVTGGIGYLLGAWHMAAVRETDHGSAAAAEAVAVRFPAEWVNAQPLTEKAATPRSVVTAEIFSPVPIAPQPLRTARTASLQPNPQNAATQSSDPHATVQTASLEDAVALPAASPARPVAESARSAGNPVKPTKSSAAAARPAAPNRSAYILDDAQIASIKARLHLTPDQEQMWPAVEAALRNIAYNRTQQARGGGGANLQAQAFDPNAVQGLKTAAVPLIMSFNEEQKEEVRNLAHVMGLDQLASQF